MASPIGIGAVSLIGAQRGSQAGDAGEEDSGGHDGGEPDAGEQVEADGGRVLGDIEFNCFALRISRGPYARQTYEPGETVTRDLVSRHTPNGVNHRRASVTNAG